MGNRECYERQTQALRGVMLLITVDIFVKIADIEIKWRALAFVQVGQDSVLNQSAELPFADAEIFRSLSCT